MKNVKDELFGHTGIGVASSQSGESFKSPYGSILHVISAEFFGSTGHAQAPIFADVFWRKGAPKTRMRNV